MGNTVSVREIIADMKSASSDEDLAEMHRRYDHDPRHGVADALSRLDRRFEADKWEEARTEDLYAAIDAAGPDAIVVGVDEVGRGAIAGPLTVAAVVLPHQPRIRGLDDSKKLSPARREELSEVIRSHAEAIGIAHVPPSEIDEHGMAACLRAAMGYAIENTGVAPDLVLIDGNPVCVHEKERCIVGGDGKVACIAAASIVAKVTRDHLMVQADGKYPGYHFAESKGYASPAHIQAIGERGLSSFHRVTFCTHFTQEKLF